MSYKSTRYWAQHWRQRMSAILDGPLGGWTPAQATTDGGVSPEHWYRSDGPLWQDAGVTPAAADGDGSIGTVRRT